jgi:hypothetical protein
VYPHAIPLRLGDGTSGPHGANLAEEELWLGACKSRPWMVVGGPKGSQIPQVPQGGIHEVGSMRGGKWSGDLTHCQ